MYTTSVVTFALAAFATLACAIPAPAPGGLTTGQAAQQCGNGQVISCCNTSSTSSAGGGGLLSLGGALDGVLGGSCTQIPVDVIGVLVPINKACGNNQAACCSGDQSGLVNVQCTPINLL